MRVAYTMLTECDSQRVIESNGPEMTASLAKDFVMPAQQRDIYPLSTFYAGEMRQETERLGDCLCGCFKKFYHASDAPCASVLCEQYLPDIVVTDLSSPGIRGLDLVEKIRVSDRNTPILSEQHDEALLLRAVTLRLEEFLLKPLSVSKLMYSLTRCARKLRESPECVQLTGQLRCSYRSKQLPKERR